MDMNLPQDFSDKMRDLLGGEFENYLDSFAESRHFGVRTNTLKITPQELEKRLDCALEPVSWCNEGFYYNENVPLTKNPYYSAGLYYIQEPSAMSTAGILSVKPGEKVLDLCASPGGKSTQLAGALGGEGVLVSNDANNSRITALAKNIELMGIKNAMVTNEAPERLAKVFANWFDKILVDAPCSGEGMFRKDNGSVLAWDKHKSERLCVIQKNILENAAKMLKAGGRLAYSTCTFAPEENERIIRDFLDENGEFAIVAIRHEELGVSKARADWVDDARLLNAARIWPHKHKGEGHFIALLQKNSGKHGPEHQWEDTKEKIEGISYYNEFCERNLLQRPAGVIKRHHNILFIPPQGLPDLKGLKITRGGFFLGELRTKRFEPSYALAMGSRKEHFVNVIDLPHNSQEIARYLKGESFDISAANGYNLICADGYPIGIVKVLNGRLKGRAGL